MSTSIVQVRGISFDVTAGVEPMARDEDIAKLLGFSRPRDIQKLIRRVFAEKLNDIHVSATVARTSMPSGGGFRETTITSFWLTEAQALLVAAKSETPVARAILDDMIAVYLAAKRGQLESRSVNTELVKLLSELTAGLTALRVQSDAQAADLANLRALILGRVADNTNTSGVIGAREADRVCANIRELAGARSPLRGKSVKSEIGSLHVALREKLDHFGKHRTLAMVNVSKRHLVTEFFTDTWAETSELLGQPADRAQLHLAIAPANNVRKITG